MEIISTIGMWSYAAVSLFLLVYSIVRFRNSGGLFISLAFGVELLTSLTWRILDLLYRSRDFNRDFSKYFEIFGVCSVFLNIISAVLLITGITILYNSKEKTITGYQGFRQGSHNPIGSVGIYITLLIAGFVPLVIGVILLLTEQRSLITSGTILLVFGLILIIASEIYFLVLLYRIWRFSIDASHRFHLVPSIETPGKAVGFLFIPFYSFYWVFQAYGKLSRDLNAVANAMGSTATMPDGLGTAIAILTLLSVIPYVGIFTGVVLLFLCPVFISQAINLCIILSQITGPSK